MGKALRATLFVLSLLIPLISRAVEVGDPVVDGTRLQPYVNQWQMHVTTKDRDIPDAGIWKDKLEAVRFAGRECWKRTQTASFKKQDGSVAGVNVTINIFDRKTMAPVYREFHSTRSGQPDKSVRITYQPGSMKIESDENSKTEIRQAKVSQAFDYDGGLYAILWTAFPLTPGFSASFASFSEGDRPETILRHRFTVTGSETIDAGPLGKVHAMVVEGDSESGPLKYWMITRPPFVLRMDYTSNNGARWLLDMV